MGLFDSFRKKPPPLARNLGQYLTGAIFSI
jgi:hypothetical protein